MTLTNRIIDVAVSEGETSNLPDQRKTEGIF